ncbi:MAG: glycine cleavage system protein H [Gemmatales bacterium]|nr:MAG: glycine cleavage system protein H [Gemmatales bacterium]
MADDAIFMMGKFPAHLPGDLLYASNHMWCRPEAGPPYPFGFTTYAVRLMQDVYFLDWVISAGDQVQHLQQIGHIETSKAVSDLFSPIAGTLSAFNADLLSDPSGINVEPYGGGWLFTMSGDISTLMTAQQYCDFLQANWEKTQRLIKGKMNLE